MNLTEKCFFIVQTPERKQHIKFSLSVTANTFSYIYEQHFKVAHLPLAFYNASAATFTQAEATKTRMNMTTVGSCRVRKLN